MTVAHATTTAHAETTAATSRPSYTAPAARERTVLTDRLASPVLRAAYAGAYDAYVEAATVTPRSGTRPAAVTTRAGTRFAPGVTGSHLAPRVAAHEAIHRAQFRNATQGSPIGTTAELEREAQVGTRDLLAGRTFRPTLSAPPDAELHFDEEAAEEGDQVALIGGAFPLRLGPVLTAPSNPADPLELGEVAAWAIAIVRARSLPGAALLDVSDMPTHTGAFHVTGSRRVLVREVFQGLRGRERDFHAQFEVGRSWYTTGLSDPDRRLVALISAEGTFRDLHGADAPTGITPFGDHDPRVAYTLYPQQTEALITRVRKASGSTLLDADGMDALYIEHVRSVAHQSLSGAVASIDEIQKAIDERPRDVSGALRSLRDLEYRTIDVALGGADEVEVELEEQAGGDKYRPVHFAGQTKLLIVWREVLRRDRAAIEHQRVLLRAGLLTKNVDHAMVGGLLYHLDASAFEADLRVRSPELADAYLLERATAVLQEKKVRLTQLATALSVGDVDPLRLDVIVQEVRKSLGLAKSYEWRRRDAFNERANQTDLNHWAGTQLYNVLGAIALFIGVALTGPDAPMVASILLAADAGIGALVLRDAWQRWETSRANFGGAEVINEGAARQEFWFTVVCTGIAAAASLGAHFLARAYPQRRFDLPEDARSDAQINSAHPVEAPDQAPPRPARTNEAAVTVRPPEIASIDAGDFLAGIPRRPTAPNDLYSDFRSVADGSDIDAIARVVDLPAAEVRSAKEHLMLTEHILVDAPSGELYRSTFEPLDEIAEVWRAATSGKTLDPESLDFLRRLIRHEHAEGSYLASQRDMLEAAFLKNDLSQMARDLMRQHGLSADAIEMTLRNEPSPMTPYRYAHFAAHFGNARNPF